MPDTKIKPAAIRFSEEGDTNSTNEHSWNDQLEAELNHDPDGELDDDEVADDAPQQQKKKKGGVPGWLLGVVAFGFVGVIGGGGTIIVMKKRAVAEQQDVVQVLPSHSQPQIVEAPPVTAAPSAPMVGHDVRPVTEVGGGAPAPVSFHPDQPTARRAVESFPVTRDAAPQSSAVPYNTSADGGAQGAALQSAEKDLAALKATMASMEKRVEGLEAELRKRPTATNTVPSRPSSGPAANTAKPAQPVKQIQPAKPMQQAVAPAPATTTHQAKLAPATEVIEPVVRRDYSVSGVVNNRAFVVRKNADGVEVEQSVVSGDKIDGRTVISVDARERTVILEGGQRITTNRQR